MAQGTRTGTVAFSDSEGVPILVDVNGRFLAMATNKGIVKIFDVSRSPIKQVPAVLSGCLVVW